jgi:hypothetical protein
MNYDFALCFAVFRQDLTPRQFLKVSYIQDRGISAFDLELGVGIKPYHFAISNMPK